MLKPRYTTQRFVRRIAGAGMGWGYGRRMEGYGRDRIDKVGYGSRERRRIR